MKQYKENINKDFVYSMPRNTDKAGVIIAFGGVGFNHRDMYNVIPKTVKKDYRIITLPYSTDYPTAYALANIYLNNNMPIPENELYVVGFSAGGRNVQNNYNPNWRLAGLIDTSFDMSDTNINYQSNTLMIYHLPNWDLSKFPFEFDYQILKLAEKINANGGRAIDVSINHYDMPQFFFDELFL